MDKNRLIKTYIFNQTFHWFIVGLIIPVLTLLLLGKGFDLFQAGIALGLNSAFVILLELPTGGLADSIGRKRVYLASVAVQLCSVTCILFAHSFFNILIGFALLGTARALSSGTLDAWFVGEYNKVDENGNLQETFARIGIFIPLGLGAGSFVGGLLPMTIGKLTSRFSGFNNYSSNLIIIILLLVIHFILTTIMINDPRSGKDKSCLTDGIREFPQIISDSLNYGFGNRIVMFLIISTAAWGFGISGVELLWQPQVRDIMGSESQTWIFGILGAGYFAADAVGNFIVTPLCRFFKNRYKIILFWNRFFMGLFVALLAIQNSIPGFTFFYWTLFIFNGVMNSPHAALFNTNIPDKQRSTLLSLESFMLHIGGLAGSLVLGFISRNKSISAALFSGAVVLSISAMCYLLIHRETE